MREIEFRGRQIFTGEWLYGYLFNYGGVLQRNSALCICCCVPTKEDAYRHFRVDDDEYSFTPEAYIKPQYEIGEIVAVAQRYSAIRESRFAPCERETEWYRKGFSNKMFVKPDFMQHQIKIKSVWLQRLQEITDDECLLEGIEKEERTDGKYNYIFFDAKRELYIRERTPRDAYARLIDALSGKGTWEGNPYVFAYDFDLVKK